MKNIFSKPFQLLASASICCLFSSCATTSMSKEARIAAHQELFETLKPKEQKAVKQGDIIKGMSKDGVYLSMGTPSRKTEGYQNGASYDRWDYTTLKPTVRTGFSSRYGWGNSYGYRHGYGYGRYSGNYHGFGINHAIAYVPATYATVTFKNDRVDSWSRRR